MNTLLLRRLSRSLMRTKLRVLTVVLLITISVYAGIVFSEHSRNADRVYDDFYAETNFADLMATSYDIEHKDNLTSACASIEYEACEASLILTGQSKTDVDWIASKFYGIEQGDVNKLWAVEGSVTPSAGEIVIDAHFALHDEINMEIGDTIDIIVGEEGVQTFTVIGIANSPLELFYANPDSLLPQESTYVVAYMDAEVLAEVSGNDPLARNTLNIDLLGTPEFDFSDTEEIEGLALQQIKGTLEQGMNASETDGYVLDRGQLSAELLRLDKDALSKAIPFILGILLFISGLVIAVSLDRLIRTQSREIAVLRTIGASTADVMTGYLLVPIVLGVPGVLFGILLGISSIGSSAFTAFYFSFLGVPVVVAHHYADIIATISLSALFITFLFGIRPAWKAARLQPLDILGQGSDKKPNRFLTKITSSLPPGIGLGLRSTFRKPARLLATLLALSLAMVILGGNMMFVSGFTGAFSEATDAQENWEYQIAAYPSGLENITAWAEDNTSAFELTLVAQATISGTSKAIDLKGNDVLSEQDNALHRLNLLKGRLPTEGQSPTEGILDEGSADLEGYKIGDTISIEFEGEQHTIEIVGIARELSRSIYMHREDVQPIVGQDANGALLVTKEGVDIEDIRFSTISIVEKETMVATFEELIEQQKAMMQSIYVLGALMAIAILFNTLLINLSERDAELATLRVLGASRSRLAIILTVEHMFIGLVGGLAGALASVGFYSGVASVSSTWIFHIPVVIDYTVFS
ncbi:MAG: FtsX-like permease family protein, partial [Candidatus Thermoplasmatota archaeon]|nr:FtsX-like permease family protein [Candidatus Thermoplasmatota archaeon]